MTIGQRIKQRRKELGLTQTELAHRLGNKSKVSVCTVENDKEDLTTDRIRKYAKALECTPAYLMGWEDQHTDFSLELSDEEGNQITTYLYNSSSKSDIRARVSAYMSYLTKNEKLQQLIQEAAESSNEDIELATEFLMRLNRSKDDKDIHNT